MTLETSNTTKQNLTRDQVDLIKRTIMIGSTDDELAMFQQYCNKTRLDPFSNQIYAVKRTSSVKSGDGWAKIDRFTTQVSIDGLRIIAERSDKYEGQTSPMWCGKDGIWKEVWLDQTPPSAAKVGVYKKGCREAIPGIATFDSYAQKYNGKLSAMWEKMPDVMLAKCAEALSLRKAFPNDMSGLYTEEEMSQMENVEERIAQSEIYEKNILIKKDESVGCHSDSINNSKTLEQLKSNYQKAVSYARSIGDSKAEKTFEELKNMIKEEIERASYQ